MIKLTALEELQSLFSDLYKDVYGNRPRHLSSEQWKDETYLNDRITKLGEELKLQQEEQRSEEAEAIKKFEATIELFMNNGAKCRETAIRWMHDSNGSNGDNEYLCFLMGVPYGYI